MKIYGRIILLVCLSIFRMDIHAQTPIKLNVGVLLPFYSDTSSTIAQKQVSQAALDYYAGLLLAAEDLNEWNVSVNFRVWDIQKMDDSELIKLPKSTEFQSLDIFIGPFAQKPVDLIATNLQHTRFLWVSPLTTLKLPKSVQNLNFFGHDSIRIKGLVHQLKLDFPNHTFYLITDSKKSNILKYYKKELKNAKIGFTEHQITGSRISPKITTKSESIILLNVGTSSFSRLAQFSTVSRKADSYIVGDMDWYDDLVPAEEIDETKIIYPSMNYIDGQDSAALRFANNFIQRERAEPSKFAFQAYDQLFFLGAHFASTGKINIESLPKAGYQGLINTYLFKKTATNTFINQGIRIINSEKIELAPLETNEHSK